MEARTDSIFAEMTRRLVQEFAPEQVILFGSHAWGRPNADSDVDLLVIVSQSSETPMERALRARRSLRGLNVPKDVLVETRAELEQARRVTASLENFIIERGSQLYHG